MDRHFILNWPLRVVMLLSLSFWANCSRADLTIEITQGIDNPTVIAVVPTGWSGPALTDEISTIVQDDLRRSGQFRPLSQADMLSFPQSAGEVFFRDWRMLGSEFILISRMQAAPGGYQVDFELFDVLSERRVIKQTLFSGRDQVRDIAHKISDIVYEQITGIRGAFSTKILYVEALNQNSIYRLMMADADGARAKVMLESKSPILSPNWSPDGKEVAYVSFETGRAAIYRQNLYTGTRQQLTNFKGLNGAPAWSPDGTKLAMVLSKDGNPEIYVLDLATKQFTRVTRHFAIDTEPDWTADGKAVIFTSDRGGKPQIYQVTLSSGRSERLTFEGDYNARARMSRDGKTLVMVHRRNGVYHIATQDTVTGDIRILTETSLDESPTLAPNGAMLLYATKAGRKGVLAAVSLDAGVKYRLPSKKGDVREPSWSPYVD